MHPPLRQQIAATGGRVRVWFTNWMRTVGSAEPERDARIVGGHMDGLVLHQLANPDPAFDPSERITVLLEALVRVGRRGVPSAITGGTPE